MMNADVDSMLY